MQWPLGKTSDLFDRRTVFILLTFLLALVALAMVPLVKTGFNALIVGIVIYGGINFALYPLALAHTNDYLSAEQVVPAAAGMILAYSLGASIGPFLAGQTMAAVGPEGLFIYTAAVMLLLGPFALLRAILRRAVAKSRQGRFISVPRMSIAGAALDPRAAAPDAGDREAEGAAATPHRTAG